MCGGVSVNVKYLSCICSPPANTGCSFLAACFKLFFFALSEPVTQEANKIKTSLRSGWNVLPTQTASLDLPSRVAVLISTLRFSFRIRS